MNSIAVRCDVDEIKKQHLAQLRKQFEEETKSDKNKAASAMDPVQEGTIDANLSLRKSPTSKSSHQRKPSDSLQPINTQGYSLK